MPYSKRKNRIKLLLLVACCCLLIFAFAITAYADGGWVPRSGGIYEGAHDKTETLNIISNLKNTIMAGISSIIGELLAPFFIMLGDAIYSMMASMGVSLESIIYGRVCGAAYMTDDIALFTFDLTNGNVYGIVAMTVYSVISTVMLIILIGVVMFRLAAFVYTSGGPKARSDLKTAITKFVIILFSVALFPKILDLVLYTRDLVLYLIINSGESVLGKVLEATQTPDSFHLGGVFTKVSGAISSMFFGVTGEMSLTNQFRMVAPGNLLNAAMYFSVNILTIYFAAVYISAAVSMVVLVVFFPVACIMEFFERNFLGGWIKQIIGILLIPMIDAALLYIPLMIGAFGVSSVSGNMSMGYAFIEFLACTCIIPARGFIRRNLGMGGSQSMELAGLGAMFGAVTAANRLGRGIGNTVSDYKEGEKQASADESLNKVYEQQAKAIDFGAEEQEKEGIEAGGDMASFMEPLSKDDLEGMSAQERAAARADNLEQGANFMSERAESLSDEILNKKADVEDINKKIASIDQDTAALRAKRAGLDVKNDQGAMQAHDLDQKIAENEVDKKQFSGELAAARAFIADKTAEREKILAASKAVSGAAAAMKMQNRINGSEQVDRDMEQMATVDNFELPAFKNISMEKKAELYQERAKMLRKRGTAVLAGGLGGAAVGGTIGLAGSMFSTYGGKAMVVSSGASIGLAAGRMLSDTSASKTATSYGALQGPTITGSRTSQGIIKIERYQKYKTEYKNHASANEEPTDFGERFAARNYVIKDGSGNQEEIRTEETNNATVYREIKNTQTQQPRYEQLWNKLASDETAKHYMDEQMRQALRDVSISAREYIGSVEPRYRTDVNYREKENQQILNMAVSDFSSKMSQVALDAGMVPQSMLRDPNFNQADFQKFMAGKFSENARDQIIRYLRVKNLLL